MKILINIPTFWSYFGDHSLDKINNNSTYYRFFKLMQRQISQFFINDLIILVNSKLNHTNALHDILNITCYMVLHNKFMQHIIFKLQALNAAVKFQNRIYP